MWQDGTLEDVEAVLATNWIADKDKADLSKVLEKFDESLVWKNLVLDCGTLTKHANF